MKFQLSLKDNHMSVLDELSAKHTIASRETVVSKYVSAAIRLQNDELVFGTEREKCVGLCLCAEPRLEVEVSDEDFEKLKEVYKQYDFDEYETEEEEISKVVRCIINFVEDEPDLISI